MLNFHEENYCKQKSNHEIELTKILRHDDLWHYIQYLWQPSRGHSRSGHAITTQMWSEHAYTISHHLHHCIIPYSGKFSRGANFRIFHMRVLHAKIKTMKFEPLEFLREL